MSFLFGGILFSLACVAIPIYLHLFVVRKKVQVIPSLKLLQAYTTKYKKSQYQNILLMIFRALILAALAFLLAQPFIQNREDLPLPPVAGESHKSKYLGIVLDDSITSADTLNSISRLQYSISWLKDNISKQDDDLGYSVCSVSYPVPTEFMDKQEVLTFLDNVSPIPYSSNVFTAVKAMEKKLKDKKAALLLCACRYKVSWKTDSAKAVDRPLVFFDTTPQTTSTSLTHGHIKQMADTKVLTVYLRGEQELLEGQSLIINSGDFEKNYTISTAEAERQEITLKEKSLTNEIAVQLNPEETSPFLKYYINSGAAPGQSKRAVIISQNDADTVSAKIIKAALESTGGLQCTILDSNSAVINDASVIILIGLSSYPEKYQAWIEEQIQTGANILFIPGQLNGHSGSAVTWAAAAPTTVADYPLKFAPLSPIENSLELLLAGLDNMPVPVWRQAQLSSSNIPALVTGNGKVLLSYKKANEKSIIWALGFSLELDLKGPIFHPTFPRLIQSIFHNNKFIKNSNKSLVVGETFTFKEIFDGGGFTKLISPDNKEIIIKNDKQLIEINRAGFYRLDQPGSQAIVANYPRIPYDNILDKKLYSDFFKEIKWVQSSDSFEKIAFNNLDKTKATKYDLTPIFAALLLLFITGEEIFLWQVWKKKS